MLELGVIFATLAFAAMFAWLANNATDSKHLRFLFLGIMFILIIFTAYNTAGLAITPESRLNYTNESSFYWNCSRNITTLAASCTGEPETSACTAYTETQCNDISGCIWSGQDCYGTPAVTCEWLLAYDLTGYKCTETLGCTFLEEKWETIHNATCDSVNVTYNYGNYTAPIAWMADSYYLLGWLLTIVFLIVLFLLFMDMLASSMHLFGRGAR